MKAPQAQNRRKIVFDLDGVLCTQVEGDYENAKPIRRAIELVNKLYKSGHLIVIHTARFMNRNKGDARKAHREGHDFTRRQLASWGVKYHELILGKPPADLVVDDRAIFFTPDWTLIERHIRIRINKHV